MVLAAGLGISIGENLIIIMNYFDQKNAGPDAFKDARYEEAARQYPIDSWVYINTTRQLGVVEEVRPTVDGPRLRIKGIGSVPVEELRPATDEEIKKRLGD